MKRKCGYWKYILYSKNPIIEPIKIKLPFYVPQKDVDVLMICIDDEGNKKHNAANLIIHLRALCHVLPECIKKIGEQLEIDLNISMCGPYYHEMRKDKDGWYTPKRCRVKYLTRDGLLNKDEFREAKKRWKRELEAS